MALDLGELVGTLRMDLTPFDQALAKGDSSLVSFSAQAATKAKTAGTDIGAKLGSGVADGLGDLSEATTALDSLMKSLPMNAKGSVDKTTAQFQALSPALKRAVTDAENQANFDKLPEAAKQAMAAAEEHIKASGVDKAAGETGERAGRAFGEKFKEEAKSAGKLAGAAAGTALGVGVVDNLSLEQARLKLAASLGMSVEDSARLGKIAGQVYADNWGENRDEVNTAIGAVVSSLKGMRKASDAEIGKATETALAYASVFEIDVPRAVSTAGVLMKSGLAGNSEEAFGLLTKASSRVPAALREDVLDAVDEYSQFFNTLGYTGPQAFDLLVQGSAKGMYGIDKAGDAIKEFTIRSTDMSTSTKGAYKRLGLDARDMANDILAGGDRAQGATQKVIDGLLKIEDPAKRANTAIALFGTPLEDLNASEIPQFLQSLKGSSDSMKGWRDSADKMAETAGGGTANSIETAKRKVIEWGRGVIESTGPTTAMAGAIAAVGPAVLMTIGPIAQLIAARSAQAAAATTTATAETVASRRSVGAWLAQSAAATGNAIKVAAAWVLSGGAAMATYVAGLAVAVAATVAGWVVMGAQATAQAIRVAAAWLIAMGPIALVVAAVVGVGILIYKNWDNIKKWTGEAWSWVVNFIKDHATLILSVVLGPIGALVIQIVKHWDDIKRGTSAAWGAIVGFVKGIPGKLLSFFLNWTIVGQFIQHWTQMKNGAVRVGGAIVSWVAGLPGRLVGALGDLGGLLLSKGQQLIAGLQQGASNRINGVVSWFKGLPGKITGAIPNPTGILSAVGGFIVDGLKAGIEAAAHKVTEAVDAIISKIPKWVRNKLGIGSPSKVMRELAQWIPIGIAVGLADGASAVEDAITSLTEKIATQFEKDANTTEKRIKDKYANIAKGIKKRLDGEAEKNALKKNEERENKALKNAEKHSKAEQKAVLALIAQQAPAIRANGAAIDEANRKLEEQQGILANMKQQALDYAASVRSSFTSFGSLTSGDEAGNIEAILKKRREAADKADQFAAAIEQLRGKLNDQDLQDLVAKGPEALTVAEGIVKGGDGAIAELNALQARMQASGQKLGDNVASTLYAAGIAGQQSLVDGLAGDLTALEAAGAALGEALLRAISKAMEGIGEEVDKGADKGTKGGKGSKPHKGGKRVGESMAQGARDGLGIRSPSSVFAAIGGYAVDGMILGLENKGTALETQVDSLLTRMTSAAEGAAIGVDLTASASPARVPESAEVARYAQAQKQPVKQEWNIYETTNPQATAAEVSRRQSFAGAGA